MFAISNTKSIAAASEAIAETLKLFKEVKDSSLEIGAIATHNALASADKYAVTVESKDEGTKVTLKFENDHLFSVELDGKNNLKIAKVYAPVTIFGFKIRMSCVYQQKQTIMDAIVRPIN